jgi:hypothetical protein
MIAEIYVRTSTGIVLIDKDYYTVENIIKLEKDNTLFIRRIGKDGE